MGKEKTEKEMSYNTHTLPNGLRVIHLPSASPVVYCGYGIAAGTRHELEGEEGMAHFCEHATFKGTSRRSALRVINTLESVGETSTLSQTRSPRSTIRPSCATIFRGPSTC